MGARLLLPACALPLLTLWDMLFSSLCAGAGVLLEATAGTAAATDDLGNGKSPNTNSNPPDSEAPSVLGEMIASRRTFADSVDVERTDLTGTTGGGIVAT